MPRGRIRVDVVEKPTGTLDADGPVLFESLTTLIDRWGRRSVLEVVADYQSEDGGWSRP